MRMLRMVCILLVAYLPLHDAHARRRAVSHPLPLLSVSSIDPSTGPIAGGTAVTIRGTGFLPSELGIFFDDQPATSLLHVSSNELRAVAPPHANGYAAVRVVNLGRTAAAQFLYTPPSLGGFNLTAHPQPRKTFLAHAFRGTTNRGVPRLAREREFRYLAMF